MISSIFNFSSLSFSKLKEILLTNENKNFEIKGYIISHMKIQNQNYINLNIQIGDNCCKEFIYYDETGSIEDGNEIICNLNKIKFSSVHNQCYIEIFDPKINKSKIKSNKSVPLFNFEIFQFVSSYNEIIFNKKKEDLFSIILKLSKLKKTINVNINFMISTMKKFLSIIGTLKMKLKAKEFIYLILLNIQKIQMTLLN